MEAAENGAKVVAQPVCMVSIITLEGARDSVIQFFFSQIKLT